MNKSNYSSNNANPKQGQNSNQNQKLVEIDVNEIIEKLVKACSGKSCKNVNLREEEILYLCVKSRDIFMEQPILLELSAPLKVCGKAID